MELSGARPGPAGSGSAAGPAGGDRSRSLWAGVLAPPTIWLVRLMASYVLIPYACAGPGALPLHLVTLATLGATGWLGWRAWNDWQWAGGGTETAAAGTGGRGRFLALMGLGSSVLFFLVIALEGLNNLLVHPCL
jgi:hypothetical protein